MGEQDGIHWHVYLQECLAESLAGDLAHRHVERLTSEIRRLRAELAGARVAERERCAKWHDEQRKKEMRLTRQDREDGFEEDGDIHENRALSHLRSAEAIRALPDEGEG